MSNVARYYPSYLEEGQWVRQVAAELGMTPLNYLDSNPSLFDLMLSYSFPEEGRVTINFRGGLTMYVTYQPTSLTVTHISIMHNGQLSYEWDGMMTVQQFLDENKWPIDTYYGSTEAQLITSIGWTVFAGAGNDIIEISSGWWNTPAIYGQEGKDFFWLKKNYGHVTISDYQVGEKLFFDNYENYQHLAADFIGFSNITPSGFTVNFGRIGPDWSLTIQGAALNEIRSEDLLFGDLVKYVGVVPEISDFLQAYGLI